MNWLKCQVCKRQIGGSAIEGSEGYIADKDRKWTCPDCILLQKNKEEGKLRLECEQRLPVGGIWDLGIDIIFWNESCVESCQDSSCQIWRHHHGKLAIPIVTIPIEEDS